MVFPNARRAPSGPFGRPFLAVGSAPLIGVAASTPTIAPLTALPAGNEDPTGVFTLVPGAPSTRIRCNDFVNLAAFFLQCEWDPGPAGERQCRLFRIDPGQPRAQASVTVISEGGTVTGSGILPIRNVIQGTEFEVEIEQTTAGPLDYDLGFYSLVGL